MISEALTLMVIGMITVFIVLFLVYTTGQILIRLVNKWAPSIDTSVSQKSQTEGISPSKIAAITAAIEAYTSHAVNIEDIKKKL